MKKRPTIFIIGSLITLVTLIAYWPMTGHEFVGLDDPRYISDNPHVKAGLTWSGVLWAFQSGYASNWHPLTWMSHMADCQLYGLDPAGHHLTNLLFHLANTLLLFLLLRRMTGSLWRSAFVAALFAWHPLHVESVAWAAERKDVLSTFWFLPALWAYVRYTEVRSAECEGREVTASGRTRHRQFSSSIYYLLALCLFALGLMSKPMLVTLPFVLLLLDFWPLRRLSLPSPQHPITPSPQPSPTPPLRLVREKLPFFVLALAASGVTYLVQCADGAVSSLELLSLHSRTANALVAYVRYLSLTLWPTHLAVLYPYSRHLASGLVIAAALLLASLSALCLLRARRQPYLIGGWLWFVGTLVPTIGLVQVGMQSMADRYTYIPSIGLFILIAWGLHALLDPVPGKRLLFAGASVLALAACVACTRRQLAYWQNSETLCRRAIAVTADNYFAYDLLGRTLDAHGRSDEALACYSEAVRLKPRYPEGQYDLGTALMQRGNLNEAVRHLTAAVKDDPAFTQAHVSLGKALLDQGKLDQAAVHFAQAVRLTPGDPEAQYNLGTVLLMQARLEQAVGCFSNTLHLDPDYSGAHANLGIALMRQGKPAEGAAHLAAAARLKPASPEAHNNLGLALLELNRPRAAADQFSESLRLNADSPGAHYHLALALARQDKPGEALPHAQKARELALAAGQSALAAKATELLQQQTR